MGRLVTLEELEAYRQEVYHAERENRAPKYRNPREVFNENPNREEGFLVELTEDELNELEDERRRKLEEREEIKQQVIDEMMENGNVPVGNAVLPIQAEQGEHDIGEYLTRDQAEQLYDNNALHSDVQSSPSEGALNDTSQAPSIAPEDSVVPSPGTIEGAPEPMQTIIENAALQGNNTASPHQNLVATPNPDLNTTTGQPEEEVSPVPAETTESTPETVDITTAVETPLPHPDQVLTETPTQETSPVPTSETNTIQETPITTEPAPENVPATDVPSQDNPPTETPTNPPTETPAQPDNTTQWQPVAGTNAGPTVPGAETIQTPTIQDEANVPSHPADESNPHTTSE